MITCIGNVAVFEKLWGSQCMLWHMQAARRKPTGNQTKLLVKYLLCRVRAMGEPYL